MAMCSNCGTKPRMISSSHKELSRCEDCQREYWRRKKQASQGYKARGTRTRNEAMATREKPVETTRTCKDCGETKPIDEFAKNGTYRKKVCKACYSLYVSEGKRGHAHGPAITLKDGLSSVVVAGRRIKASVLFVDRVNGRMVLCEVMSEKPISNDATVPHICAFYAQLGYRVVDAVELVPDTGESAAD